MTHVNKFILKHNILYTVFLKGKWDHVNNNNNKNCHTVEQSQQEANQAKSSHKGDMSYVKGTIGQAHSSLRPSNSRLFREKSQVPRKP